MLRNTHIAALGNMMLGIMLLGVTVVGVCAPSAVAQRGFAAPHVAFNRGYGSNALWRGGSFLYPLFSPEYYADALNAGYPVASQPPVVILQAPSQTGTIAETRAGEPVLIELQGDSYVRVTGPPASGTMLDSQASRNEPGPAPTRTHSAQTLAAQPKSVSQQSAVAPQSVVLVFRDGHREDISDYVITNGSLYAHTNYYTSGAWTKKIDLTALDVPETVTFNQSRGVKFQLPNAANEVIVGP